MAETDVLNASVKWDAHIQDSIGPDYGWERMRRSQLTTIKPAFGRPYSMTVGDGGHSTQFSWLNRSGACVERLKRFAEQFEDGFFTIIDQDGGGRHYVGRFVGDMPITQAGNDRYNIQGWAFEELPGCPMLVYPNQWERWAVTLRPFDDFGDQRAAQNGGGWIQVPPVVGDDGVSRLTRQMENTGPNAGDSLTHEYRGYGFRLWLLTGPTFGTCSLAVDGQIVEQQIDLYAPLAMGPTIVYANAEMPLGIHRVQVVMSGVRNVASTGNGIVWDKLEAMR